MSYGKTPFYIWSEESSHLEGDLRFGWGEGTQISNQEINAFLYKLLLSPRREELAERLKQGKELWLTKSLDDYSEDFREQEDGLLKALLGGTQLSMDDLPKKD